MLHLLSAFSCASLLATPLSSSCLVCPCLGLFLFLQGTILSKKILLTLFALPCCALLCFACFSTGLLLVLLLCLRHHATPKKQTLPAVSQSRPLSPTLTTVVSYPYSLFCLHSVASPLLPLLSPSTAAVAAAAVAPEVEFWLSFPVTWRRSRSLDCTLSRPIPLSVFVCHTPPLSNYS